MSPEEYKISLKQIKKDYEDALINLNRCFVTENRKFKTGDIICDNIDIIRVEKVLFYFKHDDIDSVPSISYSGEKLTKMGESRKDKKKATVHEVYAKKFYRKYSNEK